MVELTKRTVVLVPDSVSDDESGYLQKIFDGAPIMILVFDRQGGLVRINEAGQVFAGQQVEDDRPGFGEVFRCIHAKETPKGCGGSRFCAGCGVMRHIDDVLSSGKNGDDREVVFSGVKDGQEAEYTFMLRSLHVEEDGEPRLVVFLTDISEHRGIQKQLRQADKMRVIGQLAGGIAHDFNNILSGIYGFTELVRYRVEKDSKEFEYLNQILDASDRAKRLISQILTFSRQNREDRETILVKPVVAEALSLFRASTPATVHIEAALEQDTAPLLADSTKVHELILNLCTNAVHAMNNRGTLTVCLCEKVFSEPLNGIIGRQPPGVYSVLEVKDTGCGIRPGDLSRIFNPFFTTRRRGEGTGMGLSVVHGIVASLDGDIQVESRQGEGTTFRIFLPKSTGQTDWVGLRSSAVPPPGTERVLFVDDEQILVDATRDALSLAGYRVRATTRSVEALDALRQNPDAFDVLVTDQTMPEITGSDLIREVRRIRPDMPFVICSGYNPDLSRQIVDEMGNAVCLFKPVRTSVLAAAIRSLLD